MSTTELKIPFPSEKLDALRFFMDRKQQTVEKELQDYLDKTYEKYVPQNVRVYVEGRTEPEQEREQTADLQQVSAPRERQPRPYRRQREQTTSETPPAPEAQTEAEEPAEEETQGMTMSM